TIESHVSNMLNKTGLHNRTELSRWAIQNELI
ncbi:MAG: response regulator transcription factor, partial [Cyanobacteria bacterium]|nr:response regulator transcription factor [Cyanobacteria bacterium CG_2015-04_32_10]